MLTVSYKVKDLFFDRVAVQRQVGKQQRGFLNRLGGFIRTTARRSQRKATKKRTVSSPGNPPLRHSDDPVMTLRNILYAYNPENQSVIVGPVGLNMQTARRQQTMLMSGAVPALHELGGTAGIREKKVGQTWRSMGRRRPYPGQPTRVRRAKYPARPFMAPAVAAAKQSDRFKRIWFGQSAMGEAA